MEGSRQPFSPPVSPESMAREIAAFERALAESVAAVGPADAATLTARARLGQAYAYAGQFDAAVPALTENLAASERALGADHPDAIIARSDLAWAWRLTARLSDALAAQERCVADLDHVLGPGSAEAARARVEYGSLLRLTGQRDRAREILEQAMTDLTRTVGPEHPDTLCCQLGLADACRATGDTDGAVAAGERTAATCERLLGADDPEAISCRAVLGTIYVSAQRAGDAVPVLERARADFERVLGPAHAESVRARNNFGHALHHAGETDRAIAELEGALDTAVRVLPPQHRLISSIRGTLAEGYTGSGRHADAALMRKQVLEDVQPVNASDAAQLRSTRLFLCRDLFHAGQAAEATTTLEELVAEFDRAGEPPDKRSVDARLLLAALYRSASREAEANTIYRAVLQDARRVYGRGHAKTREVERLIWRGHALQPFRASRHPVVRALTTALALIAIIAALLAFIAFSARSSTPRLAAPPAPGYESPANAVAGYTTGLFSRRPAAACRYTAPSDQGLCNLVGTLGAAFSTMSGNWTIGHTAISGSRAIVDVEYEARGRFEGSDISVVNTDPDAGLPRGGLSFDAAFQQVFSSKNFSFAVDCVRLNGSWYVDDAQSGAQSGS